MQITVAISDQLDASKAIADFAEKCECLNIPDRIDVIQDVADTAYDFERRGKELASIGSQFEVVKIMHIDSYTVKITATFGCPHRKTLLAWLSSLLPWR